MRVLFMVIASPGMEYECMKAVWLLHWQSARRYLPDADLWFVHGEHADTIADGPHDRRYPVPESVIPGLLHKTLLALDDFVAGEYDVLVRTNLSSFFLWHKTAAFLAEWRADAAGYAPDKSHFSGCNMMLTRRAVETLLERRHLLDHSVEDDVAMSRVLMASPLLGSVWVPRFEIFAASAEACTVMLHGCSTPDPIFHVRVKGGDRALDARTLYNLARVFRRDPDVLAGDFWPRLWR